MTNLKEEILRLTIDRFQNKVESVMIDINMTLSNPEVAGGSIVDRISNLINELAIAESSLLHAKNLYNQVREIDNRIQEIKNAVKAVEIETQIKQSEK